MLIPVDAIPDIMTDLPAGFYTYPAFYDNFLATPLGSGDAAIERRFTPLAQWWRTAGSPTMSALKVATIAPATLREHRYLDRWTAKAINEDETAPTSNIPRKKPLGRTDVFVDNFIQLGQGGPTGTI